MSKFNLDGMDGERDNRHGMPENGQNFSATEVPNRTKRDERMRG